MNQNNIELLQDAEDIAKDEVSNTPYDDAHKTLAHDCPSLLIPVINEAFHENYTGDEKIVFLHNEHFINIQGEPTKEKRTDSCFEIHGESVKKYHMESQSTADSSLLLRLFEYDSQTALDDAVVEDNRLVVDFPRSAVIFLRHTKNTLDEMETIIRTPGGNVSYKIPVIKNKNYTLEEIFEKNLLFLLPFYIFRYESKFKKYEKNPEKLQELKKEYLYIREQLETLSKEGKITEYEKRTIMEMSQRVAAALARNYPQVKKGVDDVMGGKILEHEAKTILQRGIREGILEGKREGILEGKRAGIMVCMDLVKEGILSLADAARRLNMNEEELKTYLQ